MRELGAVFTGEMSGHMFFADEYYGFDDAVYAAGRLLRLMSRTDEPLSAILASVPRYPITPEVQVEVPDEVKFAIVRFVQEYFRSRHQIIEVDGARILFDDGWGLVRASNTQPALVLRAEGKNEVALMRIKWEIESALLRFADIPRFDW